MEEKKSERREERRRRRRRSSGDEEEDARVFDEDVHANENLDDDREEEESETEPDDHDKMLSSLLIADDPSRISEKTMEVVLKLLHDCIWRLFVSGQRLAQVKKLIQTPNARFVDVMDASGKSLLAKAVENDKLKVGMNDIG